MSWIDIFRRRWVRTTGREAHSRIGFWTFKLTPIRLALWRSACSAARAHARGRLLDAGAGTLLYKEMLSALVDEYISADPYSDHVALDRKDDVKELGFPDRSFDTVFCNQVLEHVDDPLAALREAHRVLRPGGTLILGVPFYFYLHGLPHDYFRFTEPGVRRLLSQAGFEALEIRAAGGYFSACVEPLNIAFTALGLCLPVWRDGVNAVNFALFVAPAWALDKVLATHRWFPCIYMAVARRP